MTSFEEVEYKEFKGKFLDQKLTKALIEESTEELRKKSDEWISAFRIRLSKDLLSDDHSPAAIQVRTRTFFVLNKYFQTLNQNLGDTTWVSTLSEVVPYCVRCIDVANKKELEHLGRLITGWATFFPNTAIEEWNAMIEQKKKDLDAPSKVTNANATAPVAAALVPTAVPPAAVVGKRSFEDAFTKPPIPVASTTSKSSVPPEPVSVVTHNTDDFTLHVLRSRTEPLAHANAHKVTDEQMRLFAIRICQFYLDRCKIPSEQVYWRLLLLSTMWLLHKHNNDYEYGEDKIAIVFASVYLAGKVEHMFLRHQKVVEIAAAVAPSIFGTTCTVIPSSSTNTGTIEAATNANPDATSGDNSETNGTSSTTSNSSNANKTMSWKELHFPDEDKLICYETELLQLIQYDATEIQNPIHTLQNMFEDLHILTEEQFYTAVKLLCKQEYLMECEFWKFSKAVTAIVFGMLMKYTEDGSCEDAMTDLYESSIYEHIRDNESILSILELLSLIGSKASTVLQSPDPLRMIERLTHAFLECNALSATDVDQSFLPPSMRR